METVLCAAVGTASHQHGLEACNVYETVLCAAVRTARHQHGLEVCTVYGRYGNMFKYDIAVLNQSALN
jgi:hypothetical protein